MADGFIVRKGGAVTEQALAPTITEVSKTETEIVFTITNNDASTAVILWEVDDSSPDANSLELATGVTSSNITVDSLADDTTFIVYATANVTGKIKSEVASESITTDETPLEYGVQWTQSTDTVVRLEDAVGLSRSDFDTIEPFASMRRCMVNDDLSINYYIDPDDPDDIGEVVNTGSYTTGDPADYTGGDGQVMVEIPKFYYKTDEPTSGTYQWYISSEAKTGYSVHPAFITDGVTRDKIYMSAFEGTAATSTGTLRSISGVTPLASRTIGQFRTQAQARGTGWQLQTYQLTQALQVLYLIEYADFDSQTTIGRGNNSGSLLNTGATISSGNTSSGTTANATTAMSYRGIENLYGNIFIIIDGINRDDNEIFVANEDFESDKFTSPYVLITDQLDTEENDFPSDITFPDFLMKATGGSTTSFTHDRFDTRSAGSLIAAYGGDNQSPTNAIGVFDMVMDISTSLSNARFGTRLQIL
jgi:hypothetical protein